MAMMGNYEVIYDMFNVQGISPEVMRSSGEIKCQ